MRNPSLEGRPVDLTVVVPVYDGMSVLPRCVEALEASSLATERWELVVVDDGSSDRSGEWARAAGHRVVRVPDGPRGPARARNLGAASARGAVLVFVDADVRVHRDALSRFARIFSERPSVGAAFGAYDEAPADRHLISQYRNLYHRYVHLRGAGPTETFWAGCGAVRRDLFLELGGFDVVRFPRPAVEDIELGYRIRAARWEILLDPQIQGTHLKRWTLPSMVRTDLLDRGVPWMRLILAERRPPSLNVGMLQRARVALVGLGLALLAVASFEGGAWLLAAAACLVTAALANLSLYRWLAAIRGWGFTARVVPFTLLHDAVACLSVVVAVVGHLTSRADGKAS